MTGGEWQIFVCSQSADGSWWQVADVPDKCVYAVLGTDALYLLSRRDAPRGTRLRSQRETAERFWHDPDFEGKFHQILSYWREAAYPPQLPMDSAGA